MTEPEVVGQCWTEIKAVLAVDEPDVDTFARVMVEVARRGYQPPLLQGAQIASAVYLGDASTRFDVECWLHEVRAILRTIPVKFNWLSRLWLDQHEQGE